MTDCIFCKIIKGDIPSQKIYEDDKLIAILDINPINPGHTLIMPKDHYETLIDAPDDLVSLIMAKAKIIAGTIIKVANYEGFNVLQNNKRCSGQAIPHLHFHIIPRKESDGVKFNWSPRKYQEGEIDRLAEAIKKQL